MVQAGQYITDGTAVFLVCDIRDGAQVGDIKMSPILRNGYVQANGALLSSAKTNYPRLVDFVQDNPSLLAADDTAWADNKALYVYDDTNDTLRVPDATGRTLQGGASVQSLEAGLPNIVGEINAGIVSAMAASSATLVATGPFSLTYHPAAIISNGTNNPAVDFLRFNSSDANPIYSASTTVQPPALSLIAQIKY